jgi:predicted O-methyltransferase YrrM
VTATDPRQILAEVDRYIEKLCVPSNDVFEQALRDAAAAGLPEINVSPNEGKLLYLLAKISGAKRVLEIGLLGGYSTLWLASALPVEGKLVTLEINKKYRDVARKNLERANLQARVEIYIGKALDTLAGMVDEGYRFDLVFIDADKENYPAYLDYALQLTHPGSLILADNVIRRALDKDDSDPMVRGIKEFNEKLATCPELEAILVPIMRKEIDGLAIARRR